MLPQNFWEEYLSGCLLGSVDRFPSSLQFSLSHKALALALQFRILIRFPYIDFEVLVMILRKILIYPRAARNDGHLKHYVQDTLILAYQIQPSHWFVGVFSGRQMVILLRPSALCSFVATEEKKIPSKR